VVEDEAIVSADIQDHLTDFGYEVIASTDFRPAIHPVGGANSSRT